jgi:hypothetical protein
MDRAVSALSLFSELFSYLYLYLYLYLFISASAIWTQPISA